MKPANFPERKRQRQLRALDRMKPTTRRGRSNDAETITLHERTARNLLDVRTKKQLVDAPRTGGRWQRHGAKIKAR